MLVLLCVGRIVLHFVSSTKKLPVPPMAAGSFYIERSGGGPFPAAASLFRNPKQRGLYLLLGLTGRNSVSGIILSSGRRDSAYRFIGSLYPPASVQAHASSQPNNWAGYGNFSHALSSKFGVQGLRNRLCLRVSSLSGTMRDTPLPWISTTPRSPAGSGSSQR